MRFSPSAPVAAYTCASTARRSSTSRFEAVDEPLLTAMRARKSELLVELRRRDDGRVGPWQPPGRVRPPCRCVRCGGGVGRAFRLDDLLADGGPVCSTCRHYFDVIMPARPQ